MIISTLSLNSPIRFAIHNPLSKNPNHLPSFTLSCSNSQSHCTQLVDQFDPLIPLPSASTPPSSWYTDSSFFDHELHRVFYSGWQAVGYTEQIRNPRDFFTGRLGNVEYIVCCDDGGKLRAFHNVCRHHGSLLASGSGQKSCFVCPYHVGALEMTEWVDA